VDKNQKSVIKIQEKLQSIYKDVIAYPKHNVIEMKDMGYTEHSVIENTVLRKKMREAEVIREHSSDIDSLETVDLTPGKNVVKPFYGGTVNITFNKDRENSKLILSRELLRNRLDIFSGDGIEENSWETSMLINGNHQLFYKKKDNTIYIPEYLFEGSEVNKKIERYIRETVEKNHLDIDFLDTSEVTYKKNDSIITSPNNSWIIRYQLEDGRYEYIKAGVSPLPEKSVIETFKYSFKEKPLFTYPIDIRNLGQHEPKGITEINLGKPIIKNYVRGEIIDVIVGKNYNEFMDYEVSETVLKAVSKENKNFGDDINFRFLRKESNK